MEILILNYNMKHNKVETRSSYLFDMFSEATYTINYHHELNSEVDILFC